MSDEMGVTTDLIIIAMRVVYEHSCPMLSIAKPFVRNEQPQELTQYVMKFWSSRKRNKIFAQNLVTADELVIEIQRNLPDVEGKAILSAVLALIDIEVFWSVDVDTNGKNTKKLLLAPLGLKLWKCIDEGPLFNQKRVSHQYIKQILTEDFLADILQAERKAWYRLIQNKIAAPQKVVDPKATCLGFYLLLNGAISQENALHLVRTDKKDFKHHDILTKGLNTIGEILFSKTLFTVASLKDDLQRRNELIQNVGASFRWPKPKRNSLDEYYWWEIGEYNEDVSTLDYVVRSLIYSLPIDEELDPIKARVRKLINYFINKVGNQLSTLKMADLFPNPPSHDFEYALQTSLDNNMDDFTSRLFIDENSNSNAV